VTLRTRLLLALLGLVALGLIVAGVATFTSLRSFLLTRVDQQLVQARQPVVISLSSDSQFPGIGQGPGGGPQANLPPGTYGAVLDSSGAVISKTSFSYGQTNTAVPKLPSPLPSAPADDNGTTIFNAASSNSSSTGFRVLLQRFPSRGLILEVAVPLTETSQTLDRLLAIEVLVSVVVLAALAAAAWLLIKRDLRPLETMAETADAIAQGDLSQRVEPAESRTEVGRLGLSLNAMLVQIEEAFAERAATEDKLRRFLADASHELRTPLTSIRGYAEVFERGAKENPEDLATAMRRIEEESKRMGVMVEELLVLARLGEGRQPESAPVDLTRVVSDAVADARAAAPDREISLELAGATEAQDGAVAPGSPAAITVMGDDHQLRQVVANLLTNAREHTPAGTPVHVSLAADAAAVLAVADEGPGLPGGETEKIFEPFYRADPSRTRDTGGAGLGLAIVAAIVAAHGGSVTAASEPGAGATFRVRLPLAATQD
jgi:two-component system OmpR family sensor kinase